MNTKYAKSIFDRPIYVLVILAVTLMVTLGVTTWRAAAQEADPHIEAFAWADRYALVDWPVDLPVSVTITNPDFTAEPFTPDNSQGWYAFFPEVDLQPGSVIVATNGETTKTLEISPLSASVNSDTGFVAGVATPDRIFYMRTDGDHFQFPDEQDITADSSGNWSVTIESYLPWEWFTRGEMWEGDDDGDITYAIWHVHNELIEVWLAQNEIRAFDWPLDTELTFTVFDPETDVTQVFTAGTEKVEWMDGTWAVVNGGDFQLKPGMEVTVTGGADQKFTTIQDLRITHFDPDLDLVSGYAPAGATLELRSWEDSPAFRYFNAGEDGGWLVDYTVPSVNDVTVDVNSGDLFTLLLREPDKDSTVWETSVPEARLFGQYTDDHFRLEYVAPGESVSFKILDQEKNQIFETTLSANEGGSAFIFIWDTRLELQPGYEIIASGESLTKHLLLEPVSLDFLDPDDNILAGTASPGREVWVVVGNLPDTCGKVVTADEEGNWLFDFDDIGCDFNEEMANQSYAQVSDAEGDTSEAFVNFIEGFHDYDTGDVPNWACNVGGWAYDSNDRARDLQLRALVDDNPDPVKTFSTGNPVDWAVGVCGADGSCGFETSLWGLITPYVEHIVTVQALDEETGQWVNLNNSPKPLTCRTYDIYAYDPLTGETSQITDMRDTDEYNPGWSPNGKKVAYDVVNGDGFQLGIYITDLSTGNALPLIGAENGNDAVWSPNGRWIAFDRDSTLYIVPSGGGTAKPVRGDAVSANWAPSGRRLVFQDLVDGSIRTAPVDGGKGRVTLIAASGANPSWSPDGSWIAYEYNGDLWKVPVNVQGTVLGDPIQVTSLAAGEGQPAWSADSQTIVYHAWLGRDYDLWSVPAAGGEPTWLTGAPEFGDYDPEYARDSNKIAYASFSPEGQSPRLWVAAYTYDPPAGTFDAETHPYHFEFKWSLPEQGAWTGQGGEFNVSNEADIHGGYVLLRGPGALRGVNTSQGLVCEEIGDINPSQPTRFLVGWVPDFGEITYSDAKAHFESITAAAVWDDGMSAELARHEIIPFHEGDWFNYVCGFTEAPPKMDLRVNYGHDWVESFYEAGHWVDITVTDGDGNVKATATVFTEPKDFWDGAEGFQTNPEDWIPSHPDLQPYDWVYAQVDNGITAQVQLGDITGDINLDTDSIQGTINAPWFSDEVGVECHPWGSPNPVDMKFDAAFSDGADLYSCSWDPATEWDIQYYQDVGVGYFGQDGHWVANAFFIRNPHFTVFPEWEFFDGLEWPDGANVLITVEGKDVCTITKESWGYFFNGNFGAGCDLEIGNTVTFTFGDIIRTHTVQNLAITDINKDENTIAGTADAGTLVYVWPHDAWFEPLQATADEFGVWQVDLDNAGYDIVEGAAGRSEIRDESGNATAVDWYVPKPRFTIYPDAQWFDGIDWPDGDVTITVVEKCSFTRQSTGGFFNGGFPEGCVVAAGDEVTFEYGGIIRTHAVRNLAIKIIDKEANTVTGEAGSGEQVFVWAWYMDGTTVEGSNTDVPALDGAWLVDYEAVGIDLASGMGIQAEIRDADGNATSVDLPVPDPRIVASITENWFYLADFIPGEALDLSIYDYQGGTQVWNDVLRSTDVNGFAWINFEEHGVDLDPGSYLLVSDGNTTKDLVIEEFTFDLFDLSTGHVAGTVPGSLNRPVWIGIGFPDGGWDRWAATNEDGTWGADFDAPVPANYTWVAAQIFDADGDASELRPAEIRGTWAADYKYDRLYGFQIHRWLMMML